MGYLDIADARAELARTYRVIANPKSFWEEARFQGVCAACGKVAPFHAHHVVDKAELKRHGIQGDALYDTRNAMRLCAGLDTAQCHMEFENRGIKISTLKLTAENIAYAYEVLGAAAIDYLRREYDDRAMDPRLR